MRKKLFVVLTLILFSSIPISAVDLEQENSPTTDKMTSRVMIGEGARILVDKGQSAKLLYDNVLLSNGGVFQENGVDIIQNKLFNNDDSKLFKQTASIPTELTINKAYPNPFNPVVNINYGLPTNSDVRILIHDLSGRKIAEFSQRSKTAGWHEFRWNASDEQGNGVGTGVYLLTINAGEMVKKQKLTFVK